MEFIESYRVTVLVVGLAGLLFWLQLVIVDIAGIKAKHIPGYAVTQSHESFLFRAHRALANSNETVGIFVLFVLFAIFSSASARWLNGFTVAYLVGRLSHMLFYYLNLQVLRSVAFAVSFASLLGIFMVGLTGW